MTAGDVAFYGTMDRWFKARRRQRRQAALAVPRSAPASLASRSTYKGTDGRAICRDPDRRRRLARGDRRRRGRSARVATARSASSAPRRICRPTPKAAANCSSSPCPSWSRAASVTREMKTCRCAILPRSGLHCSALTGAGLCSAHSEPTRRRDGVRQTPVISDHAAASQCCAAAASLRESRLPRIRKRRDARHAGFHQPSTASAAMRRTAAAAWAPRSTTTMDLRRASPRRSFLSIYQGRPKGMPAWGALAAGVHDLGARGLCPEHLAARRRAPSSATRSRLNAAAPHSSRLPPSS